MHPRIPDRLVPPLVRAARLNRAYVSADAARTQLARLAIRPQAYAPPRLLPRDVDIQVVRRRGWPVYRVSPRHGGARGIVVYAHGGGWVNEIHRTHWLLIAQIAARSRTTVVVPIYPLVPFGTAAEVIEGFAGIVSEEAAAGERVSVAGDSAGGQIALSTALTLKDQGLLVRDTVLITPALDLSWSNPAIPMIQPHDPWLGVPGARVFSELWRGGLPVDDPRVSPLRGDHAGLGGLLVFAAARDILMPDARLLVARARAAGVAVDYHEAAGQVHVYPMLPTDAGRAARAAIVARLRRGGNR